jgi:hypothetical protein
MLKAADGRGWHCAKNPEEHPGISIKPPRSGSVFLAIAAFVLAVVLAGASVFAMARLPFTREPIVLAPVLVALGAALAGWPLLALRMRRQRMRDWYSLPTLGLIISVGAVGALGCVWIVWTFSNWHARSFLALPAILAGLALGMAGTLLPHANEGSGAAVALVRRLREQFGRHSAQQLACQGVGCTDTEGIPCLATDCARVMCGPHWIALEGRCNCGTSFLDPGRVRRGRVPRELWMLGGGAIAATFGLGCVMWGVGRGM